MCWVRNSLHTVAGKALYRNTAAMVLAVDDTIAALASPVASAPRAVIRLSGTSAAEIVPKLFHADDATDWEQVSRPVRVCGRFPLGGLERGVPGMVLFWPRTSYTGQPAAELHTVGCRAFVGEILSQAFAAGARPAERGEFTLRAFLSGRLDLTQAEAVLGVIDAADADELESALRQLDGGISGALHTLREQLLIDLADLEAGLDFADEDLDFVSRQEFDRRLSGGEALIDDLLAQASRRNRTEASDSVVLVGPPNAGKSTLFNALVESDHAIVSAQSGTTRDLLRGIWRIGDREVQLIDTAGIDDDADPLAAAAERQRQSAAADAALVLYCIPYGGELDSKELERLQQDRPLVLVGTKADLADAANVTVAVSSHSHSGLERLGEIVSERLDEDVGERGVLLGTTAARCHGALATAASHLRDARALLASSGGDELVAHEVRSALDSLGVVLGEVYTDDILDRVFSRFCIGK